MSKNNEEIKRKKCCDNKDSDDDHHQQEIAKCPVFIKAPTSFVTYFDNRVNVCFTVKHSGGSGDYCVDPPYFLRNVALVYRQMGGTPDLSRLSPRAVSEAIEAYLKNSLENTLWLGFETERQKYKKECKKYNQVFVTNVDTRFSTVAAIILERIRCFLAHGQFGDYRVLKVSLITEEGDVATVKSPPACVKS